jgi:hypothetical protein
MSIRGEIDARRQDGELFALEPLLPGLPQPRVIFVSRWLRTELQGPWKTKSEEERMGRLWADLDWFTAGGEIIVGGQKDDTCHIKPLLPPTEEVWEYISRAPKPSIRVFGRFAEPDVFVATHKWLRQLLGAFGSRDWKREIRRCKTEWRRLFPANEPHTGVSINDYITENVIDRRDL